MPPVAVLDHSPPLFLNIISHVNLALKFVIRSHHPSFYVHALTLRPHLLFLEDFRDRLQLWRKWYKNVFQHSGRWIFLSLHFSVPWPLLTSWHGLPFILLAHSTDHTLDLIIPNHRNPPWSEFKSSTLPILPSYLSSSFPLVLLPNPSNYRDLKYFKSITFASEMPSLPSKPSLISMTKDYVLPCIDTQSLSFLFHLMNLEKPNPAQIQSSASSVPVPVWLTVPREATIVPTGLIFKFMITDIKCAFLWPTLSLNLLLHPHSYLMTIIPNSLRKWEQPELPPPHL
jgi:hypothetical protein